MNSAQMREIKQAVNKYFELKIDELIVSAYPEVTGNQKIMGEYGVQEVLYFSNKIMDNFREALNSRDFMTFPTQYQLNNEYGSGELVADINGLISCFENRRGAKTLTFLHKLIGYQVQHGLWHLNENTPVMHSIEDIQRAKDAIKITDRQIEQSLKKIKQTQEESEKLHANAQGLLGQFNAHLNEIEALLVQSRKLVGVIGEESSKGTATLEKIYSFLSLSNEKKEEIDRVYKLSIESLEKVKVVFDEYDTEASFNIENFEKKNLDFKSKLEFVDHHYEKFEERNKYLNDLIGREVGASLFETFKQRKNELNSSIKFWRFAVPLAALLTVYWIYALFGNGDPAVMPWTVIVINSLKALPAVGVLLFSISQYTKERNFQEEYAFKSAVALTVNSYADQLTNSDNRDKLILTSVGSIYKSPLTTRQGRQKDRQSLKDAIDAIKALRNEKSDV